MSWVLQREEGGGGRRRILQVDLYREEDGNSSLKRDHVAAGRLHGNSLLGERTVVQIAAAGGLSSVVCSSGLHRQCHHQEKLQERRQVLLLHERNLFSVMIVMMMMMMRGAGAQQAYNNVDGYICAAQSLPCTSYALYRTQNSGENLSSVSQLFNVSANAISNTSGDPNLLNATSLAPGTPFYIPLACNCVRRDYQGNVSRTYEAITTWTILPQNTFFLIANNTFEGLTTYQAILAANPSQVATSLKIGNQSTIPVRCACPSARQVGTAFLLSFAIFPQETNLTTVSSYFNVSVADLEAANEVTANTTLQPFSTLLVPLVTLPLLSSIPFVTQSSSFAPLAAPSPPSAVGASANGSGSSNKNLYVGIGIGIGIGLVLASLLGICLVLACRRKMMDPARHGGGGAASAGLMSESVKNATTSTASSTQPGNTKEYEGFQDVLLAEMSELVGSDIPQIFSYEELRDATQDFSEAQRIQGSVFLGQLRGTVVAIKQMKGNMTQELKIFTQVHHGNLVKLVGICLSSSEHLYMVFEYLENGSLSDCLHKEGERTSNFSQSAPFLPWTTRIQIALDVASGLDYIHNYTNPSFVHKDVKSSNILLDGNFRAKVANFGMAKSADGSVAGPMLTRHIVGTHGYMAPEYLEHGLVTPKADVFAFGVVLLEILSGQEAMVRPVEGDLGQGNERALSSQIGEILRGDNYKEKLHAWMDPLLQNGYPLDTACSVAQLAKTCVDSDHALRPNMKDITYKLSKILASSLEWESSAIFGSRDMNGTSTEAR